MAGVHGPEWEDFAKGDANKSSEEDPMHEENKVKTQKETKELHARNGVIDRTVQHWTRYLAHAVASVLIGVSRKAKKQTQDYVRASQALMIISIILGFFAAIVSLFGLQCIQFGTTDPVAKARMATAGGSLYILAALCALVPVSWYAFNITQQFYDPIYPGTKYELGPGLYIGWAGASLQLIGGIVLCLACRRTSGGTREYSYNYRAPRSMVGRVSKNYASEVDNSSNYGKNAYV
ncbi:claudin-15a isoform X2 [Hypanus sabinus]|uniref:claudin-15a isoform X2 n=1 Tax=Hypanus sabinus TaxID=79690 RepID=UPI0028C3A25A|nr:claudin-15a isoform X2 [Hypanus sabinus]